MSEEKLRVFGITFMTDDASYMAPLLNQAFDNFANLAAKLEAINVEVAATPFQQVFDQATQLLVSSHLLTHKEGKWQVGSMDLVESDEDEYQDLLKSVGQAASSNEILPSPKTARRPVFGD